MHSKVQAGFLRELVARDILGYSVCFQVEDFLAQVTSGLWLTEAYTYSKLYQ